MARIKMHLASAKAPWSLLGCLSDAVGGRRAGLYYYPASARDSTYVEITWILDASRVDAKVEEPILPPWDELQSVQASVSSISP
jgi:hypothetical protein